MYGLTTGHLMDISTKHLKAIQQNGLKWKKYGAVNNHVTDAEENTLRTMTL